MPLKILTGLGLGGFGGSYPFGTVISVGYSNLRTAPPITGGHLGHGALAQRAFSRPETYADTSDDSPFTVGDEAGVSEITFYSRFSSVIGRIRTDVQEGILSDMRITKRRGGCRDFTMTLAKLPDFEIPQQAIFSVQIGSSTTPKYFGKLDQTPQRGHTEGDGFTYEGFGFSRTLARVRKDQIFLAGTDVGEVVYQLILEAFEDGDCDFNFNPGKINRATGTVLVGNLQSSRAPLDKIFDSLGDLSNHDWDIDGRRDFFFRTRQGEIQKSYLDGYDFAKCQIKVDPTSIVNSATIKRGKPSGSGELGYTICSQRSNATSIAKHGPYPKDFIVPSLFTDADGDQLADRIIEELKDPKTNIKITGIPIRSPEDFLEAGPIRVVGEFGEITETIQECDDLDTTQVIGAGDLVTTFESAIIHSGAASFKLLYGNAAGQRFQMQTDFSSQDFKEIIWWIHASRLAEPFKIYIGDSVYNQIQFDFKVGVVGRYYPIRFNVENSGIERIRLLTFEIVNAAPANTVVYIDSIEAKRMGNPHYTQLPEREVYTFSATKRTLDLDCGPVPDSIESYLKAVIKVQRELSEGVEVR